MECGYITCVGECVHEGCNGHLYNPPPLSLLCPSGSAQAPRVPTPDPSFLVGCANETEPIVLDYYRLPRNTLHLLFSATIFFADLSIYSLGSKVALFIARHAWGWVVMLSRHLCFLHLLAGLAVRLTTTHPFESSK